MVNEFLEALGVRRNQAGSAFDAEAQEINARHAAELDDLERRRNAAMQAAHDKAVAESPEMQALQKAANRAYELQRLESARYLALMELADAHLKRNPPNEAHVSVVSNTLQQYSHRLRILALDPKALNEGARAMRQAIEAREREAAGIRAAEKSAEPRTDLPTMYEQGPYVSPASVRDGGGS